MSTDGAMDAILNTDWGLLQEQKQTALAFAASLKVLGKHGDTQTLVDRAEVLAGLLHWVDAAQDYFAEVLGVDVVFPEEG